MSRRTTTRFVDPLKVAQRHKLGPGKLARVKTLGSRAAGGDALVGQIVRIDSVFWQWVNSRSSGPAEIYAEVEINWTKGRREAKRVRIPVFWLESLHAKSASSSAVSLA